MAAALTLARRLRANVTSLGDLALLARVTVIMGVMPLLLRLPVPRVLRWLDAASRLVAVDDPARAARVVRYCHGLGGLRDLQIGTEATTALLIEVTGDYYLVALLDPDANTGRARFHLRMAGLELEREFA